MAKELPYFKFFVSEWSDGDITLEDMKTQGLFINLCAYYWSNLCDISLTKAKKKFKGCDKMFKNLINAGIINVFEDKISIKFLEIQLGETESLGNQNSKNAKKRWDKVRAEKIESERNATASISQSESDAIKIRKEKKRKEKNIGERKHSFLLLLNKVYQSVPPENLISIDPNIRMEFFEYWSEHGEKDKKMKFEKEKSFDIGLRLKRWLKNDKKFNTSTPSRIDQAKAAAAGAIEMMRAEEIAKGLNKDSNERQY